MKLIILSLIISISLHLLVFNNYKTNKTIDKPSNIEKKTQTNINYVKIIKAKKIVEKKKAVKTEVIKPTKKKVETKKIQKKKVVKKKAIKKQTKNRKTTTKPVKSTRINSYKKKPNPAKRKTIQEKTLEDFLSQAEPVNSKVLSQIERLYGREFETFTSVQKAFIKKNLESFQQITQRVLTRLGYPRLAAKLRIAGVNVVEFMLYPNGDIKNLKLTSNSEYEIFDKYTIKLIEIAYQNYPRPKTVTKLKFNVQYRLY
jgi:protein TonB